MKKRVCFIIFVVAICFSCCGCYFFIPLSRVPKPASFYHLWSGEADGRILPLTLNPGNIYGLGLTYATHLKETGSEFHAHKSPPVFKKALISLNRSEEYVKIPTRQDIINSVEYIEPGLGEKIDKEYKKLSPLLDYEGEMAFVLLEDIDWQEISNSDYVFKLGYFIANDISARTIAVLGEGKSNQYEYWGASKSFSGFLPVGSRMWVPNEQRPNSILRTTIITTVNGEIRQEQSTRDIMYTPREMLIYISQKYPDDLPQKGDVVLTGTPGGVAMQVPAWKSWLANVLNLDRFVKLLFAINSEESSKKFLKPGDEVRIFGGVLGAVETRIVQ